MSEKFYNVQIPYRGTVPLLNRRGPVPSVELTMPQIKELQSYGLELLNPDNGKPFVFPKPAGGMDSAPRPTFIDTHPESAVGPEEAELVAEALAPMVNKVVEEVPAFVDTLKEASDSQVMEALEQMNESAAAPVAEETGGAKVTHTFNPSMVENFSGYSNSKRKKIRARWNELVVQTSEEAAYEAIAEWVKSDEFLNPPNRG